MVLQLPFLTTNEKLEFMLVSPTKQIIEKVANNIIEKRIQKYNGDIDEEIFKMLIDEINKLIHARSCGVPKKLPKPKKTQPINIPSR